MLLVQVAVIAHLVLMSLLMVGVAVVQDLTQQALQQVAEAAAAQLQQAQQDLLQVAPEDSRARQVQQVCLVPQEQPVLLL